jgi:hypothetical protein
VCRIDRWKRVVTDLAGVPLLMVVFVPGSDELALLSPSFSSEELRALLEASLALAEEPVQDLESVVSGLLDR